MGPHTCVASALRAEHPPAPESSICFLSSVHSPHFCHRTNILGPRRTAHLTVAYACSPTWSHWTIPPSQVVQAPEAPICFSCFLLKSHSPIFWVGGQRSSCIHTPSPEGLLSHDTHSPPTLEVHRETSGSALNLLAPSPVNPQTISLSQIKYV